MVCGVCVYKVWSGMQGVCAQGVEWYAGCVFTRGELWGACQRLIGDQASC